MEGLEATKMAAGHQETVAKVRDAMASRGLRQSEVAHQAGISAPTLSDFLGGKYRGRNDEVGRKLTLWLAGLANGDFYNAGLGAVRGFVETPTARKIEDLCVFAKARGVIGVVAGSTGVGKSTAFRQVAARHGRVWYCEMMRGEGRSVSSMLRAIGRCVDIYSRGRSADDFSRAIVDKIAGSGGLLIVDEAQHLRGSDTLEELRSIFDRCETESGRAIGMVLAGHLDLRDKVSALPHLDGRVGTVLTIPTATEPDVDALCDYWELDGQSRQLLRPRARDRMGIRRIAKAYELAIAIAAREGSEVEPHHLRGALASFSATN